MRSARHFMQGIGLAIMMCIATLQPVAADPRESDPSAIPALSVAFHYGSQPPVDALQAFDIAVVEPDSGFNPRDAKTPGTAWFAYVSVGEILPQRSYYRAIPQAWLIGRNEAWKARVVDQAADGWPAFYVDKVIAPLWERGFRGFFLDTLDSYQLVAKSDGERARQEAGIIRVVRAIKARYPEARLIFNRGFEVLPEVHSLVYAVAFESLFRGWNQGEGRYVEVPQADREWLLAQARTIREQYRLPVISIDYCPSADRRCARETARRIRALGITPYVTDPALQTVGIGSIEVLPRRILVLQDRRGAISLDDSKGVRYISMPLNYLGYRVEFADVGDPLPELGPDRYAGIVGWFEDEVDDTVEARLRQWFAQQIQNGIPVAFLNGFGMRMTGELARSLELDLGNGRTGGPVQIVSQDSMMGFEAPVSPDRTQAVPVLVRQGNGARSLLRLRTGNLTYDGAAITSWGGYAVNPYAVLADVTGNDKDRWVVQPLEFLRAALRLPTMPVPDTTTENGRRLLLIHVDGDGFASRAEIPGGGFSGEVLLREIFDRYKLPMTMSVIQAELSADGMYPQLTELLEPIARKIFAKPYVEVASHTFSHPFKWALTVPEGRQRMQAANPKRHDHGENGPQPEHAYHLPVPGYSMDLHREIGGAINYINTRLAPAGKPAKLVLWPGDCQAPPQALQLAAQAGVLNLNGGDTLITRSNATWTAIAPLGVNKPGGTFQVFAPNQNENVYTNLWNGPYYGFERVIETFELTDKPYRFKPVNIYYHSYSGTKVASLKSLRKVYDYVLAQPLLPIHASDYVRKVLDWQDMAVARQLNEDDRETAWLIRGNGDLRNLRWTGPGMPDLASARGVTGTSAAPGGGVYLHLDGGNARFVMRDQPSNAAVLRLVEANGSVRDWRREGRVTRFNFAGYHQPFFRLAAARGCTVQVGGKPSPIRREGETWRVDTAPVTHLDHDRHDVEIRCAG